MKKDELIQHLRSDPGRTIAERNAYFRRARLLEGASTNGIPDNLTSTVQMLRSAFPAGVSHGSVDYRALCCFLRGDLWPDRALAHLLDFAFSLGYVTVLNDAGFIEEPAHMVNEVARVEQLLLSHGLEQVRKEIEQEECGER